MWKRTACVAWLDNLSEHSPKIHAGSLLLLVQDRTVVTTVRGRVRKLCSKHANSPRLDTLKHDDVNVLSFTPQSIIRIDDPPILKYFLSGI